MKCYELIGYNMRNILVEKLCTKFRGETIPRSFFEKTKLSISLNQQSKLLQSLFLLYAKLSGRPLETKR